MKEGKRLVREGRYVPVFIEICRGFNKYCVFPKYFVNFLNSASFAAALVCAHTLTLRENRERQESRIF